MIAGQRSRQEELRQAAIAHAEMFNDGVSMDVHFWKSKEFHSRQEYVDLSDHRGLHRECTLQPGLQTRQRTRCGRHSRTVGFVAMVRRSVSEWVLIKCTDEQGII